MSKIGTLIIFFITFSRLMLAQSFSAASEKSVDIIGEFGDITVIKDDTDEVTITIETNGSSTYSFTIDEPIEEILVITSDANTNTISISNDSTNFKTVEWANSLSIGAILNRGNADNSTLRTTVNVEREVTDVNEFIFKTSIDYRWITNSITYGKIESSISYKKVFVDSLYLFGRLSYTHNYTAALDYNFLPTAGFGYWINIDDFLELKFEMGVGNELKHEFNVPDNSTVVFHFRTVFEWDMSDDISLEEDLRFFPSLSLSSLTVKNDSVLNFALNSWLALQLKYKLTYNSEPASNKKNLDHTLNMQLKLTFDKKRKLQL